MPFRCLFLNLLNIQWCISIKYIRFWNDQSVMSFFSVWTVLVLSATITRNIWTPSVGMVNLSTYVGLRSFISPQALQTGRLALEINNKHVTFGSDETCLCAWLGYPFCCVSANQTHSPFHHKVAAHQHSEAHDETHLMPHPCEWKREME